MFCCGSCALLTIGFIILWRLFDKWYRRDFISDFAGKYVFVTGTDSGFGHKLAVDLDRLGVNVYAGCFTKEGAETLKRKSSQRLKTVELDVTSQDSVENAKNFIVNDLPSGKHLWGFVNNAGILGNVSFELSTLDDYRQLMEVNFFGPIRITEAFAPLIKKSKGRIVQVASMFGRGCVATAPYTCSKWAIEPYTDELRRYMRPSGVNVATIEPGFYGATSLIEDNVWINVLKRKWETLPAARKSELGGSKYLDDEIKFFSQSFADFPLAKYNDIGMVTEAMTHALGAKHPKTRYLIGKDARPYIILTGYTPDWFLDGFLRFGFWVNKLKASRSS